MIDRLLDWFESTDAVAWTGFVVCSIGAAMLAGSILTFLIT